MKRVNAVNASHGINHLCKAPLAKLKVHKDVSLQNPTEQRENWVVSAFKLNVGAGAHTAVAQ
jgi:hypothetical protein